MINKVSVVTGATSGIGRSIAEKILENSCEGDLVFISYGHDKKKADEFADSLSDELRERAVFLKADMSSFDDMIRFAGEIKERAGHVDWLVSSVGISTYTKFEDYTFEEWNKVVSANLSVPTFMIRELLPVMREGGSVLFVGSYAGKQTYSSSLVYGVTKAAVHFLTKALVKEFEPKRITVNAVAPGFINTSWHDWRTQESYDRINKKIALHRFGETREVAELVYSILSNGYMNGSIVDIHGGYDYF